MTALIEKAAALAKAAPAISDMRGDADYRRHLVGAWSSGPCTRRHPRQAEVNLEMLFGGVDP